MYGQTIFHGRLDPASMAEMSFRPGWQWQLAEPCIATIRFLEKARHQQWVRAEAESDKAHRRPTLLEDNPASG